MLGTIFRGVPITRPSLTTPACAFWEAVWTRQATRGGAVTTPYLALSRGYSVSRPVTRLLNNRGAFRTSYRNPISFRTGQRSFFSSAPRNASQGQSGQEPLSLSGRLRRMSKEYGWTALGVYLALSVLDFPFCYLLVKVVGTDKIGAMEHWVVSHTQALIPEAVQNKWRESRAAFKKAEMERLGSDMISEHIEMASWGVEKADERNRAEASLGTQLALAYAIHKSLIFIRVPLTAAILPKVVRVLRSWGWQIGKRRP
ncbi:hypothetical protein SODALDRAFT_129769 [Sodiomyces alkalinus F11]|uniref:DUF1279 domain-containing protein n=1 Tax=Sodiomyces alkalinus (strain CBS 110278 / VKM F-3762 / F11) TaxID=1314773 RepID=A0A3N2PJH9_SODAK|nr:hypothetical protein SODALDRAFT_129769 [Sodiomyces alkalinus F11]ROT34466.1 hypothetical protein SODALDRAFT_129769 [Sodiomyces alkalinus F11]